MQKLIFISLAVALTLVGCTPAPPTPTPTPTPAAWDEAEEILLHQIKYWTEVDTVGIEGVGWTDFYLTYISPQLIEAAVNYKVAREGLIAHEREKLLEDVNRRLVQQNKIPFILYINWYERHMSENDARLRIGPLSQTMKLINLRGKASPPIEYDHLFDMELRLKDDRKGYIFFPRQSEGIVTVDFYSDASFSVVLEGSRFWDADYGEEFAAGVVSEGWSFDLVPVEFPVERLAKMPVTLPSARFDVSIMFSILELLLSFISLMAG